MPIKSNKMINAQMFVLQDGEYKPIGHIQECVLSAGSESNEKTNAFFNNDSISIEVELSPDSVDNVLKHIVYGGDRGRYNGHVLHRDGYLNPDNAWMGGTK